MNDDRYDLHYIDWLIWRRNVRELAAYVLAWRSELPLSPPAVFTYRSLRDDWTGLKRC
jgi:hypothetical protein